MLLIGAVTAASVGGCNDPAGDGGAQYAPEVGVARVTSRSIQTWDEFNGRVGAVETVDVRARVSGYIDRVAYREGGNVKRGDLLFAIDPRPYRAALDSALAQQEKARAAAQLARAQAERARKLFAAKATSQEDLDNRVAELAGANADVRAADASVASARLNLGFTEVRASISGRVGRALLTAGNLVQADQSLLTTIVSQDPVYVYFDCDERRFLRYAALRRANGALNDGTNGGANGGTNGATDTARVALAGEHGFPHTGKVDFLDNQINPETGTIRARVVLQNANGEFTPGLYARVQFDGEGSADAMLVDEKAVLTDQNQKYVYVLGPENKALRKDIVTGRLIDRLRVVESGLAADDKVVVTGMQKIFFPGMPVAPVDVAASAPAGAADTAMK